MCKIKAENDADDLSGGHPLKAVEVYTPSTFFMQNAEPEVSPVFSCCFYLCGFVHWSSNSMLCIAVVFNRGYAKTS
jgi:hypothetical protein